MPTETETKPKAKPPSKTVLYPVAGAYLSGVPAAPVEVDAKTAERLVRTGAFESRARRKRDPKPVEIADDVALDFYDAPLTSEQAALEAVKHEIPPDEDAESEPQPDGPPSGGPSDSKEA